MKHNKNIHFTSDIYLVFSHISYFISNMFFTYSFDSNNRKSSNSSLGLFHKRTPSFFIWTDTGKFDSHNMTPLSAALKISHLICSLSLQLTRAQQRSVRRRHQRATFVSLGPSATRILRTCGESQRHATAFQGPDVLFFREPEGLRNTGVCLMACIWCRVFCRPASCEFLLFLALILKADKVYAISLWYITVHRRGCVLYGMRCSK